MTSARPVSLVELLDRVRFDRLDIHGNPDVSVTGIAIDSRIVKRNELFIAVKGTSLDSHDFVEQAVARGASVVVTERPVLRVPGVTYVEVCDSRRAVGWLANAFYDFPGRDLRIMGVTGTNGKTTVSTIVHRVLNEAGHRTGLIGTIGTFWPGRIQAEATTTTPDALTLAKTLAAMRDDGITHVSMEVSSHGIHQARIAGVPIHVGVLTGVSRDHLDYHGDYPTYIGVKRSLFFDYVAPTRGGISCFNYDDAVGEELCFSYEGDKRVFSPDGHEEANVRAEDVKLNATNTELTLVIGGARNEVKSRLIGKFNVTNLVAAAAACHALGLKPNEIASGLNAMQPIAGRFEAIDEGQPFLVIVDYAHTPDALE